MVDAQLRVRRRIQGFQLTFDFAALPEELSHVGLLQMDLREDHLALAERHICEANSRIARQQQLIRKLAQDGHDTTQAEALLDLMQDSLSLIEDHLRLLLSERNPGKK